MAESLKTRCCIAGGGPAGLMAGLLLARAGVATVVLEKHADFLRDFRGDTIHPSTLEVMKELGLLDAVLRLPHQKVDSLTVQFGELRFRLADFSHLPVACRYIAMMPQWDFLNLLAAEAQRTPNFTLLMQAEATALLEEAGIVRGLIARTRNGELTIRADLTIGADGRGSVLRAASGLRVEEIGAPMDVLWFRLPRHEADTEETQGRFDPGRVFVMLNRGDYWQCAFVIPKGSNETVRAAGLEAFHQIVGELVPFESQRTRAIESWDDVKLLTVKVDRLERWAKPGLLFIGDAAHAMSPVGGVGINLAIQDAVAAANILHRKLKTGSVEIETLEKVQRRRQFPTRATQALQVGVQNTIIAPTLRPSASMKPPWPLRLMARFPILRRIPARLVGLGIRPEHVAADIRAASEHE